MPTVQSMDLPVPKNWQEFESIVRDAQAQRWSSPTLQKNGRHGQKQHGVDILGPDEIGRLVGIQCKRFKAALKLKDISAEIENAQKFAGTLSALFVATTCDHDAKLQAQVREISDKRVASGKFAVSLLFWDEIVSSLVLNPAVFQVHYPQFQLSGAEVTTKRRLAAALELGFYGADLWKYIVLIYGEIGQIAQSDPDEFIATLRVIEHQIQSLLAPADADPILASLRKVQKGCLRAKTEESDWHPVEVHAKRVSSRLVAASSLISNSESTALDLGLQLGRIYHHGGDIPKATLRSRIANEVLALLRVDDEAAIRKTFSSAARGRYAYRWAQQIYGFVSHEIRFSR